ncbi:hypothetical protein CEP53_002681 [Fusarium sp. AF-6]|nr:hypothetical protein CEP53_002681 [Fusarium sp. AF-6]
MQAKADIDAVSLNVLLTTLGLTNKIGHGGSLIDTRSIPTSEVPTSIFTPDCLKKWISTRNRGSETEHEADTDPELFMHVDSGYKSKNWFTSLASFCSLQRSPNMLT